jgi:hypothetical protein
MSNRSMKSPRFVVRARQLFWLSSASATRSLSTLQLCYIARATGAVVCLLALKTACLAQEAQVVADPAVEEYRALAQLETKFVKRLFPLTPEQIAWLDQLDKDPVKAAQIRNAGAFKGGVLGLALPKIFPQAEKENAQRAYSQHARARVIALLTPEQQEVYKAESKARDDFLRKANAEAITILLSERLQLSTEQMDRITGALIESREIDDVCITFFFQNKNYIPVLPTALFRKHLTSEQIIVYDGLQQVQVQKPQREQRAAMGE